MGKKLEEPKVERVTKTVLKSRGWSEKLILLLDPPFVEKRNPHYLSGPLMRLYELDAVTVLEQNESWVAYQDSRRKRVTAGIAAAEKERAKAEARYAINRVLYKEWLTQLESTFRVVKARVVNVPHQYNEFGEQLNNQAVNETAEQFHDRRTVNYIRHNLTDYDDVMDEVDDWETMLGNPYYVHLDIKRLAHRKMGEVYPQFKGELARQTARAVSERNINLDQLTTGTR